ncbi:D-beta-hydroxybutyrate dehydrogenase, mitochondrial [Anabrus simplex]|uniref:D-beta-hydroxybutyrate dehydrogenase, mitochondrial n=1 Tax=Anabrus simplex TaxID=316456 RepID=UPI0035A2F801
MDSYTLDRVYRSVIWGLQAGVAGSAVFFLAQLLGLLREFPPWPVFWTAVLVGAAATAFLDSLKISTKDKAVLVTGCDSGFGYDLCQHLHDLGFVVFAGCLLLEKNGSGARNLQEKKLKNLHVIQLDITSDEQVARAVKYITEHLPSEGLWGVVNNAGWTTVGHVEWVPISTYEKIMNINVWGMLRAIKAVLPFIRKSQGRIVNVASALGRQCAINKSAYGITKYGVEALSDCLRFEMRRFGVHVAIIEPGNFVNATKCYTEESIRKSAEEMWSQMDEEVRNAYTKEYFDSVANSKIKYSTIGTTDKSPVVMSMADALLHRYPHPRYQPMEPYFKLRTWVYTHLPEWIYEKIRP